MAQGQQACHDFRLGNSGEMIPSFQCQHHRSLLGASSTGHVTCSSWGGSSEKEKSGEENPLVSLTLML